MFYQRVERRPRQKANVRHILSLLRWRLKFSRDDLREISLDYESLVGRPYFSRVWVMQEVLLAPAVSLCCGSHHQPMASLQGLSLAMLEFDFLLYRLYKTIFGERLSKLIQSEIPAKRLLQLYGSLARTPMFGRLMIPMHIFMYGEGSDRLVGNKIIILPLVRTGEEKLVHLHEAITSMRNLNCEDDRDRVYGALGCVHWKGLAPIVPDYTKTKYQLSIDVLQKHTPYTISVEDGKGGFVQDTHSPSPPSTQMAADLAQILRISSLDEEVVAGLLARRTGQTASLAAANRKITETITPCGDDFWFGYRVRHDCFLDLPGHDVHRSCVLHEAPERQTEHETDFESIRDLKTLRSINGSIIGFLPAVTREGDWVLHKRIVMDRPEGTLSTNIGLIVRASEHGYRWPIVGQALLDDLWECSGMVEGMNNFKVFFDAEDLLLLYVNGGMNKTWRELAVAEIRERLGTRVCYPDDSSYVQHYSHGPGMDIKP